jgi:hypothetical protein
MIPWRERDDWTKAEAACLAEVDGRLALGEAALYVRVPSAEAATRIGPELIRRVGRPGLVLVELKAAKRVWAARAAEQGPTRGALWVRTYSHCLAPEGTQLLREVRAAGARVLILDGPSALHRNGGGALPRLVEVLRPDGVIALAHPDDPEDGAWLWDLLGIADATRPHPGTEALGPVSATSYRVRHQLAAPLDSELAWLDEQSKRFAEALLTLASGPPGAEHLGLDEWLRLRLVERRIEGGGQLSWDRLRAEDPLLAQAGARWLAANGLELPAGAPRLGVAPSTADWTVLLGDYLRGCLRAPANAGPEATSRAAAVTAELRDLGYHEGRDGLLVREPRVTPALASSTTKLGLLVDALAHEDETRGARLRALVLCETLRGIGSTLAHPLPLDGGALGVLDAIAGDERLILTRPLVVAPDAIAVAAADVPWWREQRLPVELEVEPGTGCAVGPRPPGMLAWALTAFRAGHCRVLVTVGDALGDHRPEPNALIDLGPTDGLAYERWLLQDRAGATVWDLVCVDPRRRDGGADYVALRRRRAGIPEVPPQTDQLAAVNEHQRDALAPAPRRGLWRAYSDAFHGRTWALPLLALVCACVVAFALLDGALQAEIALILLGLFVAVGAVVAVVSIERDSAARQRPADASSALTVEDAAAVVFVALGASPEELRFVAQADGDVRPTVPDLADPGRADRAVDQLLRPSGSPRWVVSRPAGDMEAWYAVPELFAANADACRAFLAAWEARVGPGELVRLRAGNARHRRLATLALRPGGVEISAARIRA